MSNDSLHLRDKTVVGPLGPFQYLVMKIVLQMTDAGHIALRPEIMKVAQKKLRSAFLEPSQVDVTLSRLYKLGYLTKTRVSGQGLNRRTVNLYGVTHIGKQAIAKAARFYSLLQDDPAAAKPDPPKEK
jgi:hypothetical protein